MENFKIIKKLESTSSRLSKEEIILNASFKGNGILY